MRISYGGLIGAHLCEVRSIVYKSVRLSMCLKSEDYNVNMYDGMLGQR